MARHPTRPDTEILALIGELRSRDRKLTGSSLREELKRRFGVRCGTQRIYRLICTSQGTPATKEFDEAAHVIAKLTEERDTALARAELAEYRERAHQDRWAGEIDTLRQEMARLRGK